MLNNKVKTDYEMGLYNHHALTESFIRFVERQPAADVVSRGVYDQVQWERDMAMQQLEEHGIPFGANVDVVDVVRCKDCKYVSDLGMSGLFCDHPDNRNPCGCRPNDFCNEGKRKEKT